MARNSHKRPVRAYHARTPSADKGPRVAIYHRVSTLDQDPTLARGELESWVRRQGGTIALRIEETGSGALNDRPGLARVLDAARRGQLDAVIVWKLDRWGRSALDALTNIRILEDAGVRFAAITQSIDVKPHGDAMGRLQLHMLAAVAEFERDLIRERTRLGLQRARERGVQLGARRRDEVTAAKVRRLRARGKSWRQVAAAIGCGVSTARRRAAEDALPDAVRLTDVGIDGGAQDPPPPRVGHQRRRSR